jgi:alpha-mannosidase
VKPSEDGEALVVRLWNPSAKTAKEVLVFARPVAAAVYCRLDETPEDAAVPHLQGCRVSLSVRPRQIVSIRVKLKAS